MIDKVYPHALIQVLGKLEKDEAFSRLSVYRPSYQMDKRINEVA